MAFDAPDPTLYNSSIDKLSRGAQHAKAWKEYKQPGTLGRDEVDDEKEREEGVGSDDDADEPPRMVCVPAANIVASPPPTATRDRAGASQS